MKSAWERFVKWWQARSGAFQCFFLALGAAVLLFLPATIYGKGYFLLVGDFNSQQVPFYMVAHSAIRSGNTGWSWLTDLGSNFVTSYTFYLLGSPFFWLTIPFPTKFLPYLMGPLLMLKTACCALTAYLWLRGYVKNRGYAILGGFLYAFCGFAIYNIFFNHFHDVMVFFPLLLLGVDELIDHGNRGGVIVAVALCALVNYFFFFGEVIFVVMYYIVRVAMGGYKASVKSFLALCVEAFIGLAIAAVLVLPSVLAILQNERLDNPLSGQGIWMFGKGRTLNIILSFFFTPEFTSKQVYIEGAATRWTSLSAYIPVFGLSGVFCFFRTKKGHWLKTLILLLMPMSIIPILNSAFVAFNGSYYARWFYMMVLVMILATVLSYEEGDVPALRAGNLWMLAITVILSVLILFTPNYTNGEVTSRGLYTDDLKIFCFFLIFATLLLGTISLALVGSRRHGSKTFLRDAMCAVLVFGVLFGNFYIFWGKSLSYSETGYLIPVIEGENNVDLPESEGFVRMDTDDSLSNLGMFWNIPNIHCFHSIVPASVVDFYTSIGVERSVNSKPTEDHYALRSLVSVRWYFDRQNCSDTFGDKDDPEAETLMPGYRYLKTVNGYEVWENLYYIPMGFVYDTYVSEEAAADLPSSKRENVMLRGVILSPEQVERYADLLNEAEYTKSAALTQNRYFEDCRTLAQKTVSNFETNKEGFTAQSDFDDEEFLFFSVPWEEGWSCTVNGEPVQIEKVNYGFMAIRVPAGHTDIVFTYRTPGLSTGWLITGLGVLAAAAYVFFTMIRKKEKKNAKA